MLIYVSAGAGFWGPPMRVGVPGRDHAAAAYEERLTSREGASARRRQGELGALFARAPVALEGGTLSALEVASHAASG
jgi:hypothetical protein